MLVVDRFVLKMVGKLSPWLEIGSKFIDHIGGNLLQTLFALLLVSVNPHAMFKLLFPDAS